MSVSTHVDANGNSGSGYDLAWPPMPWLSGRQAVRCIMATLTAVAWRPEVLILGVFFPKGLAPISLEINRVGQNQPNRFLT